MRVVRTESQTQKNTPSPLHSSGVFAAIFTLTFAATCLGQVPGICISSDGNAWPMDREPHAGVPAQWNGPSPASSPSGPTAAVQSMDSETLRAFLNGANDNLAKGRGANLTTNRQIGNRYAPHSIAHGAPSALSKSDFGVVDLAKGPAAQGSLARSTTSNPNLQSGQSTRRIPPPHSVVGHAPKVSLTSNRMPQSGDDLLPPANPLPNVNSGTQNDLLVPNGSAAGADPLAGMGPDAARDQDRKERRDQTPANTQAAVDPHWEVFANEKYPSAISCSKCHQKIYDEWRVSGHAYSAVSPMFQRFEQAVADLTRGTSNTFCVRCHSPIATQTDFPREGSIFNGPIVFREGITCIVCHRVVERYGRVNGERRIETGSAYDPIVGNTGGDGIPAVIRDADNFKVKIDPNDKRPLQGIHQQAIQFEQLADSSFCAGCHQVLVQPGIALEVVYQQYRSGPACKKGVSCQDCHMGAVPGKPLGYTYGAAAEVSGKTINVNRKHSNHIFYGPSYPLAHPGIFPHNEKSLRWTADHWLQFDHREGWGTDAFENAIVRGQLQYSFPSAWSSAQERRDARKVIDENEKVLAIKRGTAIEVLENGSRIDGPFFDGELRTGQDIRVRYIVSNTSEGHNMPSGSLGAQPQLWMNAVLIGPDGSHLWESGHLDSNGDLLDLHSLDVRAGRFERDPQLVNFQTKFLITNIKGTEREMYLPVPVDIDPLPFFRPGVVPYSVLNHPPFIRMEAHSIPPLDSRTAHYKIPGRLIRMPGTYRLSVRMRSRVEPPYFMIFCNGTPDMLRSLNDAIMDVHPYSTEFVVR